MSAATLQGQHMAQVVNLLECGQQVCRVAQPEAFMLGAEAKWAELMLELAPCLEAATARSVVATT